MSAVVVHAFRWSAVRLRHDQLSFRTSRSMAKPAEPSLGEFCLYTSETKRSRNLSIWRVKFGGCCHCQITRASSRLLFATSRNRRAEWNAPLSGRACPLYATVFHNCKVVCGIAGTGRVNPDSDCFSLLIFCDEHRAEVLETANIIQRLTIKQDGVPLLTRDEH